MTAAELVSYDIRATALSAVCLGYCEEQPREIGAVLLHLGVAFARWSAEPTALLAAAGEIAGHGIEPGEDFTRLAAHLLGAEDVPDLPRLPKIRQLLQAALRLEDNYLVADALRFALARMP